MDTATREGTRGWGLGERLWRGLEAGVLGTLALGAQKPLRNAWLGYRPPYAVEPLAIRLTRRWFHRHLEPHQARHWGRLMRALYGPGVGALYTALRPALPPALRLRGLTLGGALWLFECLALPRLGLAPPTRTWTRAERWLLALQTTLFGLVLESVLRAREEHREFLPGSGGEGPSHPTFPEDVS
jgi:hypothetical protein